MARTLRISVLALAVLASPLAVAEHQAGHFVLSGEGSKHHNGPAYGDCVDLLMPALPPIEDPNSRYVFRMDSGAADWDIIWTSADGVAFDDDDLDQFVEGSFDYLLDEGGTIHPEAIGFRACLWSAERSSTIPSAGASSFTFEGRGLIGLGGINTGAEELQPFVDEHVNPVVVPPKHEYVDPASEAGWRRVLFPLP